MPSVHEVNFDGIVGPTHNYAGLSHGNVASAAHRGKVSNPRAAALQGLEKMKALADLGLKQAVLPPHERPDIVTLRKFGFGGTDAEVLQSAAQLAPELLAACCSASSMWVANAATVAPSSDAADGRVHFTPANLASKLHRSIEPPRTARILRAIFNRPEHFTVHEPVPAGQGVGDEGAANHTRLASSHGDPGLHLFVHGHSALQADDGKQPRRFPSRQSLEASEAVARLHGLPDEAVVFARQNPAAIDAGVFHNDVISVGNENLFLCHEQAFERTGHVLDYLRRRFALLGRGGDLVTVEVSRRAMPLADAVKSYVFNSQIVTVAPGRMALIAPLDCREVPSVRDFIDGLLAGGSTPLREVRYFDLKQSMRNGGGPACLRLRVVLSDPELAAIPPGVLLTGANYARLVAWVKKHYRDRLALADLADPSLLEESRRALDELTRILGLGPIYDFQAGPVTARRGTAPRRRRTRGSS